MCGRVCALIFVFVLTSSGLSAQQQNPLIGTWKLNVEKSTFDDRPFRSRTSTYTSSGPNGVHLVQEGITADGQNNRAESTSVFDGKPYPVANNELVDTVVNRRIEANLFDRVQTKRGRIVNYLVRICSRKMRSSYCAK